MRGERRGAVTAKDLRHPILRGVDVEQVQALIGAGQTRVYAAGDMLLREGESELFCFFLISGSVKVFYTSPDGFERAVVALEEATHVVDAHLGLLDDAAHGGVSVLPGTGVAQRKDPVRPNSDRGGTDDFKAGS